jgi:hypothetical protein
MRRSAEKQAVWGVWSLLCACATLAILSASAQAATEPHPHIGRLPGFPQMRGVMPVLGSQSALSAHAKLVREAFASTHERHAGGLVSPAQPNEGLSAECEDQISLFATQDVCYRGGPVLRDPTVHLIFWQGPVEEDISTEPNVQLFPLGYVETVKRYVEDVAHDSGAQTNVFAVDPQYFERNAKGEAIPGEYALSFDGSTDVTVDNTKFPEHPTEGCTDESEYSKGPCLLDSDIESEVEKVAATSTKGLSDVYVVLTPPGVGGCFDAESGECAYRQYCAYHSDFGGDGVTPGLQTLYADVPYVGEVEGCASSVHPNGPTGADAAIDTASHELNETITDPIGSQCESGAVQASECEPGGWTDAIGQEIADKCLPPESTLAGSYGEALGELLVEDPTTRFNQLIDGNHYYTQRVWSNEAGVFEGGCVQRAIGASFTVSANARATVPVSFDGSTSGAPGDRAVYWVWNFEGEQIGTAKPFTTYIFSRPGEHVVSLAAYDAYGNAQGTSETVSVGAAPVPPSPPPLQLAGPVPAHAHFTVAQIAAKLGLPVNGRRLPGLGRIAFGRAECPPVCSVTLRLTTRVTTSTRGRIATKLVPIGSLHLTIVPGKVVVLSVALNAKGRTMLRRRHTLPCRLQAAVEGQEGGVWQIVRSVILTGGGRSARR